MRLGRRIRGSRRIGLLFVVVTVPPAVTLAWLGWLLVAQERELDQKRVSDWLESRADSIAGELLHALINDRDQLPDPSQGPAPISDAAVDVVSLTFTTRSIQAQPSGRLPYYPAPPVIERRPPEGLFEAGENLELREDAPARAIAAFRSLLAHADPVIRAHALIRIARNYRRLDQFDQALSVYRDLERLGPIPLEGMPADLIALMERGKIFHRSGRQVELERVAKQIADEMRRGRWALAREAYVTHLEEERQLFPPALQVAAPSREQVALAAGAERLWDIWEEGTPSRQAAGWESVRVPSTPATGGRSEAKDADLQPLLLLWRTTPSGLTALIAGPRFIESKWGHVWKAQGVLARLDDAAGGGRVLGDRLSAAASTATRRAGDTHLPWTLTIADDGRGTSPSSRNARRPWLLPAALATMGLITLAGASFTVRALAHEFAVARQQSDFVAAVSHEFRTPLTSLRHLTELLSTGVVSTEERRRQYYDVMARETARLHRMVEGLLAWGRVDRLGLRRTFEQVDPVELTEQTVAEFRAGGEANRHDVEIVHSLPRDTSLVRANREALSRAVRNLLENAVKYSPNAPRVEVGVNKDGRHVAIHVHDQGFGIAREEQRTIFEKFTRGVASQALNVPGSGIGLAMTRQIVDAHDGEVVLESSPGRGTTFTIRLPAIVSGRTA